MQIRWAYSQFHTDDDGHIIPFCSDYGGLWYCPIVPQVEGGWALVQVYLNQQQIDAIKTDDRIEVCPLLFDPRPLSKSITDNYASQGAETGMNIAVLLATLADTEPRYGQSL